MFMNDNLPGVYTARRKDNSIYYRASLTCRNKHISLGSFNDRAKAHQAYLEASGLLSDPSAGIDSYTDEASLPFEKWVVLCNFRDNEVYIPNPIYVRPKLFYYFFAPEDFYIFSREDLFYYSAHKIQRRGSHCFVSDYGSQINILSRYGIHAHSVPGRDYRFLNGNTQDMQYSNIEVLNPYHGVIGGDAAGYTARIHINGYVTVGSYENAIIAAIAYNKAADICSEAGMNRQYPMNYIDGLSAKSYADIYTSLTISETVRLKAVNHKA